MRICFTRFPLDSRKGGAEVQTISLIRELTKRGHTVSFLGSCPVLLSALPKEGIDSRSLTIGPPPVSKKALLTFFFRKAFMQKALKRSLDTFNPPPKYLCMLSLSEKLLLTEYARSMGIQVVWIEHDRVGRWLTKNPFLRKLKQLSSTVTTVTVSEQSRSIYLSLGWDPARTIAIPNGIDLSRLRHDHSEVVDPVVRTDGKLHVGCIARLSEEKGVNILIDATKEMQNIKVSIVGNGPQKKQLSQMIADSPHISITNWVEGLASLYRSFDVCVLPSVDHDPFGLTVAEALISGIPVIVSDQCGIAGYLEDTTNALIIPAGSKDALSHAIEKMKDVSLRERLRQAGKKTALESFSLSRMVDQYESLFRSIDA